MPIHSYGGGSAGSGEPAPLTGDVDQVIDIGTRTDDLSHIAGTLDPQDLGNVLNQLEVDTFVARVPLGTDSQNTTPHRADGSLSRALGGQLLTEIFIPTGALSTSLGATSHGSFTVQSTAYASQFGGSASQSGSDWSNITDAEGKVNGTSARIDAANSAVSSDSYSDTLTLLGFGSPTEPAGWTRSAVEVQVRQAYKININGLDLISTLSHSLELHGSGGLIKTLESWNRGDGNQTSATVNTYPLSDSEFNSATSIKAVADCNLTINALSSTVWWEIEWAVIELTYTRTGIT